MEPGTTAEDTRNSPGIPRSWCDVGQSRATRSRMQTELGSGGTLGCSVHLKAARAGTRQKGGKAAAEAGDQDIFLVQSVLLE